MNSRTNYSLLSLFGSILRPPRQIVLLISDEQMLLLEISSGFRVRTLKQHSLTDSVDSIKQISAFYNESALFSESCLVLIDNLYAYTYCRRVEIGKVPEETNILKTLSSNSEVIMASGLITCGRSTYMIIQGIEKTYLNDLVIGLGNETIALSGIKTVSAYLFCNLPFPEPGKSSMSITTLRLGFMDFVVTDKSGRALHSTVQLPDLSIEEAAENLTALYINEDETDVHYYGMDKNEAASSAVRIGLKQKCFSFLKRQLTDSNCYIYDNERLKRSRMLQRMRHLVRVASVGMVAVFIISLIAVTITTIGLNGKTESVDQLRNEYIDAVRANSSLDSLKRLSDSLARNQQAAPPISSLLSLFCQERFNDLLLKKIEILTSDKELVTINAFGNCGSEKVIFDLLEYLNKRVAPYHFVLKSMGPTADFKEPQTRTEITFLISLLIDVDRS